MKNIPGIKNQVNDKNDFFAWLLILFDESNTYLKVKIIYGNVDVNYLTTNGVVYNCDLYRIMRSLFQNDKFLSVIVYKEATIFGTKFQSRGMECREEAEAKEYRGTYGQQNAQKLPWKDCNDINNFHKNNGYSSWFSFKSYSSFDQLNAPEDEIGQFNGFFRLHFELEPLLHGLPLGSMTGRKHDLLEHSLIRVKCKSDNYLSSYFFVPLTEVYSTQLGILAFDKNNKVIATDKSTAMDLEMLLFIELHRHRKCIIYEKEKINEYNQMEFDDLFHE